MVGEPECYCNFCGNEWISGNLSSCPKCGSGDTKYKEKSNPEPGQFDRFNKTVPVIIKYEDGNYYSFNIEDIVHSIVNLPYGTHRAISALVRERTKKFEGSTIFQKSQEFTKELENLLKKYDY